MDADQRYKEKSVAVLAANGMRAFLEYMPVLPNPNERDRIYTKFSYGPLASISLKEHSRVVAEAGKIASA
jgi:alkaline phosphatase D